MNGLLYDASISALLADFPDSRRQYDAFRFLASLQGVLNRESPTLFFNWDRETDDFWFHWLTEEKGWPGREIRRLHTLRELLDAFAPFIREKGLTAWDTRVPATANVAATICGAEDILPLRRDPEEGSLFRLLTGEYAVPVRVDLCGLFTGEGTIPGTGRPSTGSAKCDAYLWAMEHYLDKTSLDYMGYALDGATWGADPLRPEYPDMSNASVPNQDYLVARRAFVFDLGVWEDEAPCDDPGQPLGTDRRTLQELLQRQYDRGGGRMVQVMGFIPWMLKYTDYGGKSRHGAVDAEWKLVEILTAYNCLLDADAPGMCGLANASLYRLYPLKEAYRNNRPASIPPFDPAKRYLCFYIGDYDAAAWTARYVPHLFKDPVRGKIPMAWGFNPNLSDRIPMAFDYLYENAGDLDFFISGDSGAGYVNPSLLLAENRRYSRNPDGLETWEAWNRPYFRRFDLSITGFLLNGANPIPDRVFEAYARISPDGAMTGNTIESGRPRLFGGMPAVVNSQDVACLDGRQGSDASFEERVKTAADIILAHLRATDGQVFMFRTVLCSPTFLQAVMQAVCAQEPAACFTDPYTFYAMAAESARRAENQQKEGAYHGV